ncbi:penicillin-binding protein 1A [Rhodospirillaceae bacterium KN72]|uniref:Penicillin-binding protein 1A n=1 Tax=Pacificispira spongiicola TaxID=2729598 RepID=A0A7Y0HD04_9PROT|nr:penicillin-binding protein 1A [Pacificispira spongiicola]NMM43130.1 penicillin-binding protein 1A [Pacificispira spongiicola]
MRFVGRAFLVLFFLAIVAGLAGAGAVGWAFWHYGKGLPDFKQLADYEPPTSTRVHAGDGRLLAEFATESRVFVPIESIPVRVRQGFMAAEDQHFYDHFGVDLQALFRAVVTNVVNVVQGRRLIGASTITQQVAKNFLLTNEVSMERKIKEAILALRIERALSKDRILELYLNEIYLGYRSYGVAAAALNYFDKSLDDLSVAEIAYLAALPKAPNNYHPTRRREAAIARRNWVVDRMLEEKFITPEEASVAKVQPLDVKEHHDFDFVDAGYFLEEVRRELGDRFGETGLYEGGMSVRTTLDPVLQDYARTALRDGLIAYDRRHGYRGPIARVADNEPWREALHAFETPAGHLNWLKAAVIGVADGEAKLGFEDGSEGVLPLAELRWARKPKGDVRRTVGASIKSVDQVLSVNDIILVEPVTEGAPAKDGDPPVEYPPGTYALRQIPEVNGAIVAMDPHTGRVLAMSGGWSFETSQFNRATQALRQPGSSFKPFVYLTALENGFTPATIILDAPFVIDQGFGLGKWKPSNFSNEFYGPSPMRVGIEKSRNLMTVRLAQEVGMEKISETVERFGIVHNMPPQLAMSLGSADVRLIDMVSAYSALVNGGKKVVPTLIDRIQDRNGHSVFRHDTRDCPNCTAAFWDNQPVPQLADTRPQLTDPASAYQIVTMLEGVVQRGTGRRIAELGKPLGGKTGTTNDSRDAWFIGFSPDLAVGAFVGFDTPIPLGYQPWGGQETGSSVAAPIFKEFMGKALADKPAIPFRTPPGIRMVRIDAETGKLASPSSSKVITEAFKAGTEPGAESSGVFISGRSDSVLPVLPQGGDSGDGSTGVSLPAPTGRAQDAPSGLY